MRLSGFGIYRYELPFTEPLTLKDATLRNREGLLLRLTGDDGSEGWGEATPLPGFSREGREEVAGRLRELGGSLLGREVSPDWMDPDGEPGKVPHLADLPPSARFGLELAAWNLLSATDGKTMAGMMRPLPVETVWLNGLLSGFADKVLAGARRMRDAGYRTVKLKVGNLPLGEDAELARAVSRILGGGISLRLDANRAWSFEAAMEFVCAVRDTRIEYIEEPLADVAPLPRFADQSGVPVALDESLVGMAPEELAAHDYARAVVLKPTLLGGISRTLRLAEEAHRLGMTPVISSAYETGVGTLGLISLAAIVGEAPAGLDTYRRLARDVLIPPLDLGVPRIDVGEALGIAREVDRDGLETVAEL